MVWLRGYTFRLPGFFFNIFLFSLLFLTGCGSEPQTVFKIGTNTWIGYEPLYLSREMNYFDGKKVGLVELTSNSEVIRAFRNGTIDGATLTLDEVLLLKDLGIDARVILVLDISAGADVIMGQPDIKTMADAKGKRIGFENTALGSYMLARALQTAGLSKEDSVLVPLEADEHEKAFSAGEIDLVVTFEPVRSKLLAKGANILFDSSRIPNEIADVLVVRPQSVEKDQKILKHILEGWYKALLYLEEEPQKAAEIMEHRPGLSAEEVLSAYEGLVFPGKKETYDLLTRDTSISLFKKAGILADVMYDHKLLKKKVETSILFDNRIISEVQ